MERSVSRLGGQRVGLMNVWERTLPSGAQADAGWLCFAEAERVLAHVDARIEAGGERWRVLEVVARPGASGWARLVYEGPAD